jgi:hypothetical protein
MNLKLLMRQKMLRMFICCLVVSMETEVPEDEGQFEDVDE